MSTLRRCLSFLVSSFVMVVLALIAAAPAWGVGFQPVSAEELKMLSEPKAPGAPAIILFRQVDRDDRGLTAHEDVYFRIKILTEEGRKYADVEIPYWKSDGKVVGIHARTLKPDGSIVDFSGKAFDKEIVKTRGVKYLQPRRSHCPMCKSRRHHRVLLHNRLQRVLPLRVALDP